MAFTGKNVIKNNASVTIGASQTDSVVTGVGALESFYIPPSCTQALVIDLEVSAVVVAAAITAKLQVRYNNGQAWANSKTASITATGTTSIRLLHSVAGDQGFLPLKPQARVVITTGGGDSITITAVHVPVG